jgi:hypothetical protein
MNRPPPGRRRAAGLGPLAAGVSVALAISACSPRPAAGGSAPAPSAAAFASSAAIWFQPQPAGANGALGRTGSADYLSLFQPNAPWPRVMAHLHAFGLNASWIYSVSDQVLRSAVAFLTAHRIGIEIEAPALQAQSTCGSGIEGYVPFGLPGGLNLHSFTLTYLRRLKALGAQVPFIKVDEPYYYGSAVSDALVQKIAQTEGRPAARPCHLSVTQVARDVGQFAHLAETVYPHVAVGDVEPVSTSDYSADAVSAIDAWHDTYTSVTGAPFPFFFADVDFSDPAWPALVKHLETATRERGTRFGIIYTGDRQDDSDAEWTGQVVARFEQYQRQAQGQPDYVLFQSWQSHPVLCLPETNPTSFTGVISTYLTATGAS